MSKELPYFRFTAFEWLNDDISLETYETKGLFIDVCAYYWFKDCTLTNEMLDKKFSNAIAMLKQLFDIGIIKESEDGYISIKFLDEQYDLLSEKRKKRQYSGSLGGLKRSSNAKAMLKQKDSYKDKNKDKDNNNDKYDFVDFVYRPYFEKWLKYKSERKESYKSETSVKSCYNKLITMSNKDSDKFEQIIEQSIANNWAGLFELKTPNPKTDGEYFDITKMKK